MSRGKSIINVTGLICGAVCAACAFLSRTISGNAFDMAHKIQDLGVMPSMWIFNLLSVIWYFVIGVAIGMAVQGSDGACRENTLEIYRGGLFFVTAFFLGLIWYPMFFVTQVLFLALLVSIILTACAVVCAYAWFKAGIGISGVAMSAFSVWSLYVVVINFATLMSI